MFSDCSIRCARGDAYLKEDDFGLEIGEPVTLVRNHSNRWPENGTGDAQSIQFRTSMDVTYSASGSADDFATVP
jgi:hypothetical protein